MGSLHETLIVFVEVLASGLKDTIEGKWIKKINPLALF